VVFEIILKKIWDVRIHIPINSRYNDFDELGEEIDSDNELKNKQEEVMDKERKIKYIISATLGTSPQLTAIIAEFDQKKFFKNLYKTVNENPEKSVKNSALDLGKANNLAYIAIDTFVKSKKKPEINVRILKLKHI